MHEPILKAGSDKPPTVRSGEVAQTGEGIIDESTFKTIEVDRLFDSVNHSETVVGQATLYRSLVHPLASSKSIQDKQDAVMELESNPTVRKGVEALVNNAARNEQDFFNLLYGTFLGMFGKPGHDLEFEGYGYGAYRKGTGFMLNLVDDVGEVPRPESRYLEHLLEQLRAFGDTRWYSLMAGPAYKTEKGFLTKDEKGPWTPAFAFRPTLFKPLFILFVIGMFVLIRYFAPVSFFQISPAAIPALAVFLVPAALAYIPIVGTFDRDDCIYPLREDFKNAKEIEETLEALGNLDELLSFFRYKACFGRDAVFPLVSNGDRHIMIMRGVKNPILAKDDTAYRANDLNLEERLTFITGPNSGGKTAICKTAAQVQLLAQVGCPVPAKKVETIVSDRIFYQTPEFSSLEDDEGRFGTELKRTKEIFLAASPKSLVIFDELSEGTTYEEKLETSATVLDGFIQRATTTILITHNHELVDKFIDDHIGQALQVEFEGYKPTYRLIKGISRVSHADRVAEKIGFSKKDIEKYLKEQE